MQLENKKIGVAITGSFCTLSKSLKVLEDLKNMGANVQVILSENVANTDTRFWQAKEFRQKVESIVGKKCWTTIEQVEKIGPQKLLDVLVVIPCTGNTTTKLCYGITDTSVTMACKAHLRNDRPVVIGISTNDGLGNCAKNIGQLLARKNIYFVPFGQDDWRNKASSLVADFDKCLDTIQLALEGKQLQPLLI